MTAEQFIEHVDMIGASYTRLISQCDNLDELEKIRVSAVGKNGFFTQLQRELGKMIKEDRA
jgi:hypothetical protein